MKIYNFTKVAAVAALLSFTACENSLLEQEPVDLITNDRAIEEVDDLDGAILGAYSSAQVTNFYGNLLLNSIALMSDEGDHTGTFPTNQEMDVNNVLAANVTMRNIWNQGFKVVFNANSVIAGAEELEEAEATEIAPYIAEAKALRALGLWHLSNLWGDIPYPETTSLEELGTISRTPRAEVLTKIIADLEAARADLPATYDDEEADRTRFTQVTVDAFLARAYLYVGKYAEAAAKATAVINSGSYSLTADYASAFADGSTETIMEVYYDVSDANQLAFHLLPADLGGRFEYGPSADLIAALDAEAGDARKAMYLEHPKIANTYYINKYNDIAQGTDRPKVFRLAEMYLIAAEAIAQNSNVNDQAVTMLNAVRTRAGLAAKTTADYANKTAFLSAVEQERFKELAFEGHRMFDLVRTGRVDAVMSAHNPAGWANTDIVWPIPQQDKDLNPNLGQNDGY
ncbi:RagB/SusD family nutrient uptake outer membrane protein [Algivirga pacifica]|uniref:RagB/SusD family nutrient uptake outer membrane protein n=1 Tax=Algivirga pacifica TaxID=1162670 RepID=A0ABP9DJW7_9BACT